MPDYTVNLKNPVDTPEQIAEKLNTLTYAVDAKVIRGTVPRDEFDNFKDKTTKYINSNKERIDTNDLRWHGGGISKVVHDATLTGDGTANNPLGAVVGGTPGGSNGDIQFNNAGSFGGVDDFYWDNSHKRLGIGTTAPELPLTIYNTSFSNPQLRLGYNSGSAYWDLGRENAATGRFQILNASGQEWFSILMGGNVGINNTAPAYTLDVDGTANMTGFRFPTSPVAGYVLTSDSSGNGTWQPVTGGGTGTVTSVSVISSNGLAGTVANATTTPAITLTTTITGLLKGNGTAISAATADTDYSTPTGTETFTNKTYDTAGTGNVFKINGTGITAVNGTGAVVLTTSPSLVTPTLGVASATTINKVTLTAPATGSTLTIADGKTLTANNSLTLAGTDSTTMTFPSTNATIARTDAANTFTGVQTTTQVLSTNNAITASGNAATVPVTSKINTVTNNSAATLTITLTTAGAIDRQIVEVLVLDSSAATQTITWVNTENSSVTAPTTSNGSTTLPLAVLFQFNNATTKWRTIAVA